MKVKLHKQVKCLLIWKEGELVMGQRHLVVIPMTEGSVPSRSSVTALLPT